MLITTEGFTTMLARNALNVNTHLKDVTHSDALRQPPFASNCLYWVLGHIMCYRNYMHDLAGDSLIFDEAKAKRFARDSAPVLHDEPGFVPFADLMRLYAESQTRLIAAIEKMPQSKADETVSMIGFTMKRGDMLLFFGRHEAYHAGNLEVLRAAILP